MRTATLEESGLTHCGSKVVMNPDVGKSSTAKQIWWVDGEFKIFRLTLPLSPTLIVIEVGVTIRAGSDCWLLLVVALVE